MGSSPITLSDGLSRNVVALAKQAGAAILTHYHGLTKMVVQHKFDHSPLTEADLSAHRIIEQGLMALTPTIPILSEESSLVEYEQRQQWQQYWLVDPLDGTKEFLAGNDEFTVNIALIEKNEVVLGVVYVPAKGDCYYAYKNSGAFYQKNGAPATRLMPRAIQNPLKVLASRRHNPDLLQQFLACFPDHERVRIGSSLKFCLIAAGEADVYPRFGATSEWDTAAAQCILEEAGGHVVDLQKQRLMYNTKASLLNPNFIAYADNTVDWLAFLKDPS